MGRSSVVLRLGMLFSELASITKGLPRQRNLKNSRMRQEGKVSGLRKCDFKPGDHIYSWRGVRMYTHHGIYYKENRVIHLARGMDGKFGMKRNDEAAHSLAGKKCPDCKMDKKSTGVILSCLKCFQRGYLFKHSLHRYEYGVKRRTFLRKKSGTCTMAKSVGREETLIRAEYLLKHGDFGAYHLFENNCEDFAIFCKTGLKKKKEKNFIDLSNQKIGVSSRVTSLILITPIMVAAITPHLMAQCVMTNALLPVFGNLILGYILLKGVHDGIRYANDIGVRKDVDKVPVDELILLPKKLGFRFVSS